MYINYLNKDISHIDRVPQVVTYDSGFYKFIQNYCTYADESSKQLYNILNNITNIFASGYAVNVSISYLERLITKFGIVLPYMPENITDENKRLLYITALQGFALKRVANGTKQDLYNFLLTMYPPQNPEIPGITINDRYNAVDSVMSYTVTIDNFVQPAEQAFLANYIIPEITGVNSFFTFNINGYLSGMILQYGGGKWSEISPKTSLLPYAGSNGSFMWKNLEYIGGTWQETVVSQSSSQADYELPTCTGTWVLEVK